MDAGEITAFSAVATLPGAPTAISDDPDAGLLWVLEDGSRPDGGLYQGLSLLDDQTLATIADVPLAGVFTLSHLIALPGLHKAYFGYGSPVVVTAMDETSYAMTPVTTLPGQFDAIDTFAYDPVHQLAYVVAGQAPWYIEVIDATHDQLVATLTPDAGSTDCSTTSSTSCLLYPYQATMDVTGQELYLGGNDQYYGPMAATVAFSGVDGGALQNPVGGQAAGWYAEAFGLVPFEDGGAMAGVWLGADAGGGALSLSGGFEVLDPGFVPSQDLPYAIAPVDLDGTSCGLGQSLSIEASTATSGEEYPGDQVIKLYSGTTFVQTLIYISKGYCPTVAAMSARMVSNGKETCLHYIYFCSTDTPPAVVGEEVSSYCCPPN